MELHQGAVLEWHLLHCGARMALYMLAVAPADSSSASCVLINAQP